MRVSRFVPRLGARAARAVPTMALPALALIASSALAGQRAVVDPEGTLYELLRTRLLEVDSSAAGTPREHDAVLALRTTTPAGLSRLEVVGGSQEAGGCGAFTLERDAATATLLVACTNLREPNAGLRLAVHRDGAWTWREIASGSGPAVARNPKAVVTRQRYVVLDGKGMATEKSRTIFHVVWRGGGLLAAGPGYLPGLRRGASRPPRRTDGGASTSPRAATLADAPGAPSGAVAFPRHPGRTGANGGVSWDVLGPRVPEAAGRPDPLPRRFRRHPALRRAGSSGRAVLAVP
ncbi:MAG: hypothetical protein IPN83_26760 [Holophagales bacterium]|nr:hypothetical protein [Holophagales bacterium]